VPGRLVAPEAINTCRWIEQGQVSLALYSCKERKGEDSTAGTLAIIPLLPPESCAERPGQRELVHTMEDFFITTYYWSRKKIAR